MRNVLDPLRDLARSHLSLQQRRRIAFLRLALRRPTAGLRLLPDFLILGAQRCGTSSLYRYLGRHPWVSPSLRKEVDYFSTRYAEGESWYRAHFPLRASRRIARLAGRRLVSFEASVDYLLHPLAAARAAATVPDAKLIVMVRDPVERAWSHWRHMVRLGLEDLDFASAIECEVQRLAGEMERAAREPERRPKALLRYSYQLRGRYARHLEPWLEHFPRRQVRVVRAEDLFAQPAATYAEILRFLELPPDEQQSFPNYSYARSPAGRDVPPPPVAALLRAELADEANRLSQLIGEEIRW